VTQPLSNLSPAQQPTFPRPRPALSRRQKAAIIVRLMLKEGAQLSLDALPEAMQMDLTHEMGAIRTIDRATLNAVIDEFMAEVEDLGAAFPGGLEGALDLLDGALSTANLRRLRRETGIVVPGDPWDLIAALPAERLALMAEQESSGIAAIMLSKLPVTISAKVLGILPTNRGREIAIAMSGTGKVDPDTVRTIGHALAAQVADESPPAFDGAPVGRIGEILNSSKPTTRDGLLTAMDEQDADLTAEVRRRIFTFTDIAARVEPRDIPKVTRAIDQELLVMALAVADGRDAASVDFILANMSQRMAGQLRDEIEDRGQVKPDDSEDAKSQVVAAIRDLERAGELALRMDTDVWHRLAMWPPSARHPSRKVICDPQLGRGVSPPRQARRPVLGRRQDARQRCGTAPNPCHLSGRLTRPPVIGAGAPVVSGLERCRPRAARTARKAKACASIMSPSSPTSSTGRTGQARCAASRAITCPLRRPPPVTSRRPMGRGHQSSPRTTPSTAASASVAAASPSSSTATACPSPAKASRSRLLGGGCRKNGSFR